MCKATIDVRLPSEMLMKDKLRIPANKRGLFKFFPFDSSTTNLHVCAEHVLSFLVFFFFFLVCAGRIFKPASQHKNKLGYNVTVGFISYSTCYAFLTKTKFDEEIKNFWYFDHSIQF